MGLKPVTAKIIIKSSAKEESYNFAKELLETLSKRKIPRSTTVIIDQKTGKIYKGVSNGVKNADEVVESLSKKLPATSKEPWDVINCSEVDAYNKALKDGANPRNLEMHTVKIDKKTGSISDFERCKNCKVTTKDIRHITSE